MPAHREGEPLPKPQRCLLCHPQLHEAIIFCSPSAPQQGVMLTVFLEPKTSVTPVRRKQTK